jgi:hypothetical protein
MAKSYFVGQDLDIRLADYTAPTILKLQTKWLRDELWVFSFTAFYFYSLVLLLLSLSPSILHAINNKFSEELIGYFPLTKNENRKNKRLRWEGCRQTHEEQDDIISLILKWAKNKIVVLLLVYVLFIIYIKYIYIHVQDLGKSM